MAIYDWQLKPLNKYCLQHNNVNLARLYIKYDQVPELKKAFIHKSLIGKIGKLTRNGGTFLVF